MPDIKALLGLADAVAPKPTAPLPVAPVAAGGSILPPTVAGSVTVEPPADGKPDAQDANTITEAEAAILRKFGFDPNTIGKAPGEVIAFGPRKFHVQLKGEPPKEVEATDRLDAMVVYNRALGINSTSNPYTVYEV